MKEVVLISCVSKKLPHKAPAGELYTSDLFKKNFAYAKRLKPDAIYILSAKYGLLGLDEEVETYNQTLNTMSAREVEAWAKKVLMQLGVVSDIKKDKFVFLAGERYRKYLVPHMVHTGVPMRGLGIGKQLQFLKLAVKSKT